MNLTNQFWQLCTYHLQLKQNSIFLTKALHHEVIVIHHHFLQAEGEANKVFIVVSLKMTQVLIKLKMDGNVILFLGNIVGEKVLGKIILQ